MWDYKEEASRIHGGHLSFYAKVTPEIGATLGTSHNALTVARALYREARDTDKFYLYKPFLYGKNRMNH